MRVCHGCSYHTWHPLWSVAEQMYGNMHGVYLLKRNVICDHDTQESKTKEQSHEDIKKYIRYNRVEPENNFWPVSQKIWHQKTRLHDRMTWSVRLFCYSLGFFTFNQSILWTKKLFVLSWVLDEHEELNFRHTEFMPRCILSRWNFFNQNKTQLFHIS